MTVNRKLAPIEQSTEIFNRHGGSFNILTISRIKGLLNEATLRQALDLIQFRHPQLKSCIVSHENELYLRVSCTSSIDLRQHLTPKVNNEHLVLLSSAISSFHTLKANTSFWDLAREVKQYLKLGLQNKDIFTAISVSKIIYDFLLGRPNKTPMTVIVTNIGQVDIKSSYGSLQLEDISFVPSQAVFGGVFGVAVTTFKLTMTLNFMFSEPSISRETMEILASDVVSEIITHATECPKS